MKLVVGLGNTGRKYEGTRHNVGFEVLAQLAREYGSSPGKSAFHGEVSEASVRGHRTLLLAPHTLMNLSGTSVLAARDFYKIENADLLIICDDFHLPLGRLRMRVKGSAGGQKGLADIIRRLGSEAFARLRVGIGEPPANWDAADFVLSKFTKQERPEVDLAVRLAADAVALWAAEGTAACMNRYNRDPEKE
ncbi:MAG: aminoacyl-tRNA hydrolase [Pirellulales bacterium]|nr:aminoacyl-tRNA hydrolase [Pirellulales bacterium]